MTTLLYTGLGELQPLVERIWCHQQEDHVMTPFNDTDANLPTLADLVVVGPEEKDPVKAVQKLTAMDKYISVVLLVWPSDLAKTRQLLQFAPFVGKNHNCIAYSENLDLKMVFQQAAQRTRQRRSFSKLHGSVIATADISSRSVQVADLGVFLDQAPIGALLLDQRENVLALNEIAKRIFRIGGAQHYELKDLFPGLSLHQFKTTADTGRSKEMRIGELFLDLHLSEVTSEQGDRIYILLFNDITEQKGKEAALTESEALFRFMAEVMPQKLWTADADGKINFFNKRWEDYTGKSLAALYTDWPSIIHPEDIDKVLSIWDAAIASGMDFELEARVLRKDGLYEWHLVRGSARKENDGKVLMWVGTNTNIHQQKAFTQELEKRVKERTYELESSNHELEQFVYVTSHDLQEPLRKIRLFSDMMKRDLAARGEQSNKQLDKIVATAERMSALLKALLNFTQMSREEQMVETDLNQIVADALVDLELVISQKNAEIKIDPMPVIRAIPVQMHQLFFNLLNNALKFSRTDIRPLVEIEVRLATPEEVAGRPNLHAGSTYYEIIVRDNGIGFDQANAGQIFHIFQRLHNRNEYSGTGIGLALCKRVVTNHYGDLYAISEPGQGAAFHIWLPAA